MPVIRHRRHTTTISSYFLNLPSGIAEQQYERETEQQPPPVASNEESQRDRHTKQRVVLRTPAVYILAVNNAPSFFFFFICAIDVWCRHFVVVDVRTSYLLKKKTDTRSVLCVRSKITIAVDDANTIYIVEL